MDTAQEVRNHIEAHDRLIRLFDMQIQEVLPGTARVSMKVGPGHLNAAGICHGGAIFSLADVTFALAVNSLGVMALALEVSVNYLRPASEGTILTATAEQVHTGKSTALFVVEVKDESSQIIAFFKATAFRLHGRSVAQS